MWRLEGEYSMQAQGLARVCQSGSGVACVGQEEEEKAVWQKAEAVPTRPEVWTYSLVH